MHFIAVEQDIKSTNTTENNVESTIKNASSWSSLAKSNTSTIGSTSTSASAKSAAALASLEDFKKKAKEKEMKVRNFFITSINLVLLCFNSNKT